MTRFLFYVSVLVLLGAPWWLYVLLVFARIIDGAVEQVLKS